MDKNRLRKNKYAVGHSECIVFSVIANKVRDVSNEEQLGLLIRWMDKEMEVLESFIGLIHLTKFDAEKI